MTVAIQVASNAVLGAGEILVDEAGDVFGGNGTTISSLSRLARKNEVDLKAPTASPVLTGTPTVPTAAAGTNTTQAASTAFVSAAISTLVGAAPAALSTLQAIDAQLASDEGGAAALAANVATRLQFAQPNTTYATNAVAVNPTGQIVTFNNAGTTGASYDSTLWTVVAGYDGGTSY